MEQNQTFFDSITFEDEFSDRDHLIVQSEHLTGREFRPFITEDFDINSSIYLLEK